MQQTPWNPDKHLPAAEQFARIAADKRVVEARGDLCPLIEAHFYNRSLDAARKQAEEMRAAIAEAEGL